MSPDLRCDDLPRPNGERNSQKIEVNATGLDPEGVHKSGSGYHLGHFPNIVRWLKVATVVFVGELVPRFYEPTRSLPASLELESVSRLVVPHVDIPVITPSVPEKDPLICPLEFFNISLVELVYGGYDL